jgi:hypothetical protein
MQCQLVNETVVPEMVKRDNELPLYFEVNLAKRVFRSRPKALREEEMVKLQRAIRKFLAWKRLKCMIENTYYMYLNKVFLYESEYKFWLRIYKKLQK